MSLTLPEAADRLGVTVFDVVALVGDALEVDSPGRVTLASVEAYEKWRGE